MRDDTDTSQLRASIPSEQVPGQENDFQDVNDNTQSPNGPRADRTRSSTFGRLRERVSRKNIRAQNGNDMPSAPDSNLRPQPSRDSLRPVPMERSYGQSGWRRLTNQLSLPNLRSAAKRKLSEYQAGQQDRDQAYAGSSFRIKRLTVAHPPVFTYQEYQRSLQNVHGLNPFRDELGRAIPVSAQATQDVEMLDACVAGPSSPRNLYSNEDALAALEGRAPHDDGRNWDRDRHIDELAGQWPLKQYTRTREATHDSLGSPGDLVEVLADASDLPVFDNKQQRRL